MSEETLNRIHALITPILSHAGTELVDIEYRRESRGWVLRLYIDKEGGVTLDDCTRVSQEVGRSLDVEEFIPNPYTLEVSSPGLDRPLQRDKDFLKYRGFRVNLRLREKIDGRRHFCGELTDYEDGDGGKVLVLSVGGKTFRIPREAVLKANLVYEL